jgi:hypothetical protein
LHPKACPTPPLWFGHNWDSFFNAFIVRVLHLKAIQSCAPPKSPSSNPYNLWLKIFNSQQNGLHVKLKIFKGFFKDARKKFPYSKVKWATFESRPIVLFKSKCGTPSHHKLECQKKKILR